MDSAEEALQIWLAGGPCRQGDRLPPEHEVATMLGVSRGTLRSALRRLEERGEIVRRQGSGTFVGRSAVPAALGERLSAWSRIHRWPSAAGKVMLAFGARAVPGEVTPFTDRTITDRDVFAAELGRSLGGPG